MKVGAHDADVVGHVAVRGKDIEMAVEIVVEEEAAEGKRLRRRRSRFPALADWSVKSPEPSLW